MSGWGTKDDKTSSGTVAIDAAGAVTGTSTAFTSEAQVGDYLLEAGGQELIITAITSDTVATVASPENATISAVSAGAQYTLSEKPKFMAHGDATNVTSTQVFGVDRVEMSVTNGPAHAGWNRRTALSGAHNGRVQYETLVALSSGAAQSAMSDADDDTEFPDA